MTMDRSMIKRLVAQGATQPIIEEIERLRAECNEQARLLGISGSREAKLMADIETLRKELAEANSFIESLANACEVAEARVLEYSREV